MKYTKKELELIFKITRRSIDRFEVKALEVAKENDIDENKFNELFEEAFDEVLREFFKRRGGNRMKEKLLKEVKKLLDNKELTREELLLSLFIDEDGDLYLSWLDFSDFEGNVWVSGLKVKKDLRLNDNMVKGNLYQNNQKIEGDLYQNYQEVKGNLYQGNQKVEGGLYQNNQKVEGNLYQSNQKVEGDYYATNIKVKGEMYFEEPTKMFKKITLQELKEMGYELEEKK